MKRMHLFEFTDQPWYPQTFRRMQTDYLQFAAALGSGHKNLVPLFIKALSHSRTKVIVDLCSGGTGPWMHLKEQLRQAGMEVKIILTDKYPNPGSIGNWKAAERQGIEYLAESVDAMHVPDRLGGMRTLFEGFHHFRPEQAKAILQDAEAKKAAIGIFEASLKPPLGWLMLLLSPIITLLTYILITPFLKPPKISRFIWTYLLPIVPLATCWDGVVSMLRVYSPEALRELAASIHGKDFVWEAGIASTGTPVFNFTYLLGYPLK